MNLSILILFFDETGSLVFGCCVFPLVLLVIAGIKFLIDTSNENKQKAQNHQVATIAAEYQAKKNAIVEAEAADILAQKDAKDAETTARQEAESLSVFQEKRDRLIQSPEYNFIGQFAKKFENKVKRNELLKLQMLLEDRGWDFQLKELLTLIDYEFSVQRLDSIRARLLLNNPLDKGQIIDTYLNHYQSNNDEALSVLANIIQEKHLNYEDLDRLRVEVRSYENQIELKNFERRLADENEQISLENIDQLNGYEFEDFLKNLFSKMGYQVEQTKLSGDQGADLVVVKFGEKTVIQAKRYGAKVGNYAVQEIMAAISLYKAQKGMVVTNSYFTPAAVDLANANNIELIDRDALEELIDKHW